MKRMESINVTWEGVQSAPNGFVGISFLMQICDRVDVYGFDAKNQKLRYHYFDKEQPLEDASTEFEHNLLRSLHNIGVIRLCTSENIGHCMDQDALTVQHAVSHADVDLST